MFDMGGRTQHAMSRSIHKYGGLGCIRELAEHEPESEPVNSLPLWFWSSSSSLEFLP